MKPNRVISMCIAFVGLLFTFNSIAQTYRIDTSTLSFENKLRPCLYVQYDSDARTVKKAWAGYMKRILV